MGEFAVAIGESTALRVAPQEMAKVLQHAYPESSFASAFDGMVQRE